MGSVVLIDVGHGTEAIVFRDHLNAVRWARRYEGTGKVSLGVFHIATKADVERDLRRAVDNE